MQKRNPITNLQTIQLGEHIKPGCYVQIFSEALWQSGADQLLKRFDRWCESLDLRLIQKPGVSRADWAFDYNLPLVDFTADHFVSRAAKDGAWRQHQRVQTFHFGKGDIVTMGEWRPHGDSNR